MKTRRRKAGNANAGGCGNSMKSGVPQLLDDCICNPYDERVT